MARLIPPDHATRNGSFAVVFSKSHPSSKSIMTVSCIESLETSGVARDNIYVVESPTDMLLAGVCGMIAKSGKFQAVIGLAVLPASSMVAQAMHTAFALQDFGGIVVPALVPADDGAFLIARTSEEAARHAIEVSNLPHTLERLTDIELGELDIRQARMQSNSKRSTNQTRRKESRRLRGVARSQDPGTGTSLDAGTSASTHGSRGGASGISSERTVTGDRAGNERQNEQENELENERMTSNDSR